VKAPPKRKRSAGLAWNILTILVLIATVGVAVIIFVIYINPNSKFNPFPALINDPISSNATATLAASITLVPSWTPTPDTATPTETPQPTLTPLVSTSTAGSPLIFPSYTPTEAADYAFVVQQGSPVAIDAAQFHPDAGCHWTGVAGQAISLNGEPVKGLFVELGGGLNGVNRTDNLTMTGMAPQYGQGGFEITLADTLVATRGRLWIQLLDQQNLPLSGRVFFDTYDDCTKNLIIISFEQVR
jgi:hypothetical protein